MSFKRSRLLTVLSLGAVSSCASADKGVVVTSCVNDPLTHSLLCIKPDGGREIVPWERAGNYVCSPENDYLILLEEARKR